MLTYLHIIFCILINYSFQAIIKFKYIEHILSLYQKAFISRLFPNMKNSEVFTEVRGIYITKHAGVSLSFVRKLH